MTHAKNIPVLEEHGISTEKNLFCSKENSTGTLNLDKTVSSLPEGSGTAGTFGPLSCSPEISS